MNLELGVLLATTGYEVLGAGIFTLFSSGRVREYAIVTLSLSLESPIPNPFQSGKGSVGSGSAVSPSGSPGPGEKRERF